MNDGGLLECRTTNWGDWRDSLVHRDRDGSSEDWSVSNGRTLELLLDDAWIPVSYEVMRLTRERRVWLYFDHADDEGLEFDRRTMRLR